jgi:hypothetical protein
MAKKLKPGISASSVSVGDAMARSADSRALIEAVLVIVGPDGDRRSVKRDVLMACGFVRRAKSIKEAQKSGRYGIVTDAQKKAAKGFARTLHKLYGEPRADFTYTCRMYLRKAGVVKTAQI